MNQPHLLKILNHLDQLLHYQRGLILLQKSIALDILKEVTLA